MDVAGRVALRFTGDVVRGGSHVNLTAVRADGEHLWVAGDETATIDRLVLDSATAPTRAGRQRSFRLADLVQLPGPPEGETDLQGVARSGGWLWAIGSHALVRRRPKPIHDDTKVVRRLGKLRRDPNRFIIVRLAVQLGVDRHPEPVRVARDGRRSALVGAPHAETLVDLLRTDTHLAPFLAIPGQDNGFDVGGLAVVGDRLYVGLRGPVLRGWAVVLEVRPAQDPTDPGRLALGIFPEGVRYRKHVLDLGGLGVRDLCPDGDDLLVLAGPTMALSGPVRVHRWWGAVAGGGGPVVRDVELPVETVVPNGEGVDHASAISLLGPDTLDPDARLLVVYANPAANRRPWPDTVLADRVRIAQVGIDAELDPVTGDDPGSADSDAVDMRTWARHRSSPTSSTPRPLPHSPTPRPPTRSRSTSRTGRRPSTTARPPSCPPTAPPRSTPSSPPGMRRRPLPANITRRRRTPPLGPGALLASRVTRGGPMSRTLSPPSATDTIVDRLFEERIVYLAGTVDDEAAHRITAQLLLLAADDPTRDITFYVNSPGGSVTAGMAIYDTMQLVTPDVATWAVGLAGSMGQFLLTAGAPGKRYALPHARILMHQPSASLGGTASDVTIRAGLFGEMKREIAELTARHSGQPVEAVTADSDRDRWFDAEQARAYGLVDHVAGRTGPTGPTRRIGFLGKGPGNPPG